MVTDSAAISMYPYTSSSSHRGSSTSYAGQGSPIGPPLSPQQLSPSGLPPAYGSPQPPPLYRMGMGSPNFMPGQAGGHMGGHQYINQHHHQQQQHHHQMAQQQHHMPVGHVSPPPPLRHMPYRVPGPSMFVSPSSPAGYASPQREYPASPASGSDYVTSASPALRHEFMQRQMQQQQQSGMCASLPYRKCALSQSPARPLHHTIVVAFISYNCANNQDFKRRVGDHIIFSTKFVSYRYFGETWKHVFRSQDLRPSQMVDRTCCVPTV